MSRARMCLGVLCLLVCVVGEAWGEIPQMISYQGKVTDASGNPVADGNYTMRFRIYNVSTGGTALWDSGARTVAVAGGVFSVLLGESPQPAITLDFNADYWLLVTFAGVDQTPRQRMASVGYAYMASGVVPGTQISGSLAGNVLTVVNSSSAADASALRAASTAGSGYTHGVYAEVSSPDGSAVFARGLSGTGNAYGVYAQSLSSSGRALYGCATATSGNTYGVYGQSNSSLGWGVVGWANATSGETFGGHFTSVSPQGVGVYGRAVATSGITCGGRFESSSTDGMGVRGSASATSGYAYGVWGESSSNAGRGVFGWATATTGTNYGVYGLSYSTAGTGVYGWGGYCGLHGYSSDGDGIRSFSDATNKSGVYGVNNLTTGATYGVYGRAYSPAGYAVYYSGNLGGTGTKSCIVKTSKGPTLMYCQESPENWFEDFGEGTLVDGRCHIELDPFFLETVTIDDANPMKVFLQACDESCLDLIVHRGQTAFDVVSPTRADAAGAFMYRVVAKRKGFEAKRLDVCEAARTDSYLYPELREKEQQELEAREARRQEELARHAAERVRMEGEEERAEPIRVSEADR